jgi:hypothetical protein
MRAFACIVLALPLLVGPASAEDTPAQTSALRSDTSARQHPMSSRHRHWHRVAVSARACPGFTIAPTLDKTYGDKRWPYVNWRGACDSLYAPGPAVTFVRSGSY